MAWISGNYWLSESQMQNNATIVYNYLKAKGWTLNAIAGMLGNMQVESSINPGIWEKLTVNYSRGYGLVQWTPATNYTNWATEHGYDISDGDGQLVWIDEYTDYYGQWIPTATYPMTFPEYKVSTDTPEALAYAFLYDFERPGSLDQPSRQTYARNWYNYFYTDPDPGPGPDPGPDPGPGPTPPPKSSNKFMFYTTKFIALKRRK